jgi:hypothetical protein
VEKWEEDEVTLNLGLANLIGLLIIVAGIAGFVVVGRRHASEKKSSGKGS